jgi:hypothetical protein
MAAIHMTVSRPMSDSDHQDTILVDLQQPTAPLKAASSNAVWVEGYPASRPLK